MTATARTALMIFPLIIAASLLVLRLMRVTLTVGHPAIPVTDTGFAILTVTAGRLVVAVVRTRLQKAKSSYIEVVGRNCETEDT